MDFKKAKKEFDDYLRKTPKKEVITKLKKCGFKFKKLDKKSK